MRVVLDTNVLVAGLLSPLGTCGEIVRMLTSGNFSLCVDARTLFEYHDVLRRPHFDFDPSRAETVLEYIRTSAEVFHASPLAASLPDPDDAAFLEVAIAAKAKCLVTGNLKHFPASRRCGARVLLPAEFLDLYRKLRAAQPGEAESPA
jgi:putative PIN family toxin of toxin-antitoxin system